MRTGRPPIDPTDLVGQQIGTLEVQAVLRRQHGYWCLHVPVHCVWGDADADPHRLTSGGAVAVLLGAVLPHEGTGPRTSRLGDAPMYNHSHLVTATRRPRRWRPLCTLYLPSAAPTRGTARAPCPTCGAPGYRPVMPAAPGCPLQIAHCGFWHRVDALPWICPACGLMVGAEATP